MPEGEQWVVIVGTLVALALLVGLIVPLLVMRGTIRRLRKDN